MTTKGNVQNVNMKLSLFYVYSSVWPGTCEDDVTIGL